MSTNLPPITPFPSRATAPAAAPTENTAPAPAPVAAPTLPVMMIPLMCTSCGNRLTSVYSAATKGFLHVHQEPANAPKCPLVGKKYIVNGTAVEEYNG